MPMAEDQCGVGAQEAKFHVRKIECAHRAAIRVIFFVTRENGVPATRNAIGSGKGEIGGMPITSEKCINVAAIPGFLLRIEHGTNGAAISLVIGGFVSGFSDWR